MDAPRFIRRWFCLTPGWLVVGLLVVEGLLWLSERFQWFAFNSQKGWTVLIAVAVVGVAMMVMPLSLFASLLFRRRFQFSIRSLLLLVVAVAIPCSWLAVEMQAAEKQRQAADKIRNMEGQVSYDCGPILPRSVVVPDGPVWLRRLLGNDFFNDSVNALLFGDTEMEWLEGLPNLQLLSLGGNTMTDAGLRHLDGLTQLRLLSLGFTRVSDAGLQHLERLTRLQVLSLSETNITDSGLQHLRGLTRLETLYLEHTQITDTGLETLKRLTRLQHLELGSTKVTDEGVKHLQQALPKCEIRRTASTY
jgi:Leucine-rich repeat (LRR) protein